MAMPVESGMLASVTGVAPAGFTPECRSLNASPSVRPLPQQHRPYLAMKANPMTIVHFSEPNSFFRLYCGLTKNRIGCLASLAM